MVDAPSRLPLSSHLPCLWYPIPTLMLITTTCGILFLLVPFPTVLVSHIVFHGLLSTVCISCNYADWPWVGHCSSHYALMIKNDTNFLARSLEAETSKHLEVVFLCSLHNIFLQDGCLVSEMHLFEAQIRKVGSRVWEQVLSLSL